MESFPSMKTILMTGRLTSQNTAPTSSDPRTALCSDLIAYLDGVWGKGVWGNKIVDDMMKYFDDTVDIIQKSHVNPSATNQETEPKNGSIEKDETKSAIDDLTAKDFVRLLKVYPKLDGSCQKILLSIADKPLAIGREDLVSLLGHWLVNETDRPRVELFLEVLQEFETQSPVTPEKLKASTHWDFAAGKVSGQKECQMILHTGKTCSRLTSNYVNDDKRMIAFCPEHAEYRQTHVKLMEATRNQEVKEVKTEVKEKETKVAVKEKTMRPCMETMGMTDGRCGIMTDNMVDCGPVIVPMCHDHSASHALRIESKKIADARNKEIKETKAVTKDIAEKDDVNKDVAAKKDAVDPTKKGETHPKELMERPCEMWIGDGNVQCRIMTDNIVNCFGVDTPLCKKHAEYRQARMEAFKAAADKEEAERNTQKDVKQKQCEVMDPVTGKRCSQPVDIDCGKPGACGHHGKILLEIDSLERSTKYLVANYGMRK